MISEDRFKELKLTDSQVETLLAVDFAVLGAARLTDVNPRTENALFSKSLVSRDSEGLILAPLGEQVVAKLKADRGD